MRNGLVQMKATEFFTRNSPHNGAILHGDPGEKSDMIARYPQVSEADAVYLEKHKLASRHDGALPKADDDDEPSETVDERAAREVEEVTDADQSVEAVTGLDTRATTAFEKPVHELASSASQERIVLEPGAGRGESAEDDAPASGKRAGKASRSESAAKSE